MTNNFDRSASNSFFYIHHKTTNINAPVDFILHQHLYPEVYFFISGDVQFVYEGSMYKLFPYDIMIVPPNTMHQPIPNLYGEYTRYVLHPLPDFYNSFDSSNSLDIFKRTSAKNAKISGSIIKNTDILNILHKIEKYSDDLKDLNKPVITHLFYEIIYILNSITDHESYTTKNIIVQSIVEYINENYQSIKSIDEISQKLNYSTSYISALFKKNTGTTIHDYIIKKRLANTEFLFRNGETLTSACMNSGFPSYNNFAYTYKKINKKSPKNGLKN